MRSSITEHSFHGIDTSALRSQGGGVTHVSGTKCHPCLRPLNCPRKRRGSLKASHNCSDGTLSLNGASYSVFGSRST
jgi:hypothetical protein